MGKVGAYLLERFQSLTVYLVILGIVAGIWLLLHPKNQAASATYIRKAESGSNVSVTNINNPVQDKQGLYVAITSDRSTVGVFKQMTPNFRLSLGAGESYDGEAVAEVRGEVSF